MLREAISGLKMEAGAARCSTVMPMPPPVVMLTTQSDRCLITLRNGANASGDWSGLPSLGLRACRCTMAAPAWAAPMAASAISAAVIGRCGDIDGVWIEPVTAQVMMTLRALAMDASRGKWIGPKFKQNERAGKRGADVEGGTTLALGLAALLVAMAKSVLADAGKVSIEGPGPEAWRDPVNDADPSPAQLAQARASWPSSQPRHGDVPSRACD